MPLLSPVSAFFCVMRQSAMAGVGFLLSAEVLSDHSLGRGEIVKLKTEHSLEHCGEPSWQAVYIVPVASACKIDHVCLWKCQKKLKNIHSYIAISGK